MGLFEYTCGVGHITERLVSLKDRPEIIPCEHEGCALASRLTVSAARTTFHANDRKSIKGHTVNRGGIRT